MSLVLAKLPFGKLRWWTAPALLCATLVAAQAQAALTVSPTTLASGTQNVAYSRTITASGGTTPYTFSVTGGALPSGLALSSGGVLSGTPTANGSFSFTVTANDAAADTGTRNYTLVIAAPVIAVAPATLPNGRQNVAYSRTITATGGTAPYTYAVIAGAMPAGLTLSTGGALTGTPTVNGSFSFTVRATDAQGYSGTRTYTLVIAVPAIAVAPTTLPSGRQNVAYSRTITASGGTAPYTYAVTAGALPAGLTLSAGGTLAGTPTVNGSFAITITATDSQGYAGSRAYTLVIAVPAIAVNPTSLTSGRQNVAYSRTLTASGGTAPYGWAVTAGALPAGLTLSSAGVLSGTPTVNGSFTFTATATDSQGYPGSRAYTLVIAVPMIAVTPTSLPTGRVNVVYSQALAASGGTAPYGWAVTAGALPAGLSLSGAGVLSGTPTANGTFTFTATATDNEGYSGSRAYSLVIAVPLITVIPASPLPAGRQFAAYSQTIGASGGATPYTFVVSAGALPAGLSLSGAGLLSGVPTASGSFSFTIRATDSQGYSGTRAYTLSITAGPVVTLSPTTLPAGNEALSYSQVIAASGGTAPYSYAVTSGALPPGLTLTSGGTLSGTPISNGSYGFTVTATDAQGYLGARTYALSIIAAPTITLAPSTLPTANENLAYSQTVTATGGTAPYGYSVTSGALPPGLTLSSGGVLSGSPTGSGSFNFTIIATDAMTYTGAQSYTLTVVAAPTITIAPTSLPAANENLAYSQTVTATGGTAPYGYAVMSGALPPGLTLSSGGVLSGSPTASGSFNFTVTATDAMTYTASQSYTLAVGAASTITIAPSTLPVANQDLAYSQAITASGGTEPYGYAVTSGALPPGLTLSSDGQLAGTPTTNGTFSFTATATDAIGYAGAVSYSLGIDAAPTIVVSPGSLQAAVYGVPYQQAFTAAGSAGPFTFAVTSGALPPGMNLSEDGMLSGTPTAAGSYDFTVTATDPQTYAGSSDFSLVVEQRPDPTDDPTLRNSVQAQVDAMQRLAFAQLQNVNGRLEQLRSCHDSAATMSVRVEGQGDFDAATGQGEQDSNCDRALAFWVAGTIIYGGDGSSADVRAPALTMGADLRVGDDLVLGLGFGAGSDSVRPGGDADNTADGYSFMGYGSWHAGEVLRIEGALGYGTASLSGRRVTSYDGARVSGKRDAGQLFGSLTLAGDLLFGRMSVQPYLRTDYQSASLDPYVERGGGPLALRFHATDTDTLQYAGGLRVVWSLPVPSGLLQPMLRYEYRSLDGSDVDQAVSYADGIGGRYRLTLDGATQDTGVLGVGLGFTLADGVSGSLEYQTSYGDDLAADSMYTGNLSWSF